MSKVTSQKTRIQKKAPSKRQTGANVRISYILIILAYVIVPVATPILEAFDANGPKFLAISILNLLSFGYLLTCKELRIQPGLLLNVFKTRLGFLYLMFLFVVMLSFFKAYNIFESVINFSKIFTIFSAAYVLAIVLRSDNRYLTYVSGALSALLIFDSFTVFYHILQYIGGSVPSIYTIKSVYSNKNILTAAIFVKIPFAIYLFSFRHGWLKTLGISAVFFAFLATFFMSTRTFYIGLLGLTMASVGFYAIRYFWKKEMNQGLYAVQYLGILLFSYLLFWGTQKLLYPKQKDVYNVGVVERLSNVLAGGGRYNAWKQSIKLIKEEPLLGVGTGNWKIQVLKYENKIGTDYTYMYKNHNDFLETAAETGIIGGGLFLAIFLLTGFNFILVFFKTGATEDSYRYQFFAAFGLFAYSFDAFFNFPADRPEIGALFAVYVAAGIAYAPAWLKIKPAQSANSNLSPVTSLPSSVTSPPSSVARHRSSVTRLMFSLIMILLMVGSIYVFIQNYRSTKLQRLIKGEMASGKLTLPSDMFMTGFPFFPTVSLECEPIAVHKARYLITESKFQQAIDILKPDRSSPYDTRQEFFISMAYYQLGNIDSSLVYSKKVFAGKPLFFNNTSNLCRTLDSKGQRTEAISIMEQYIQKIKSNNEAWIILSALYDNSGDYNKAASVMDSALKYLPADSSVMKQQRMLSGKSKIKPYEKLYFTALEYFNQKKYPDAIRLLTEFIEKEPRLADAYDFRAFAYFFLNDHKNSITDIEHALALGPEKPNLLNLRGVNYHMLANDEAACRDFKRAAFLGDKDGITNMQKFCNKK